MSAANPLGLDELLAGLEAPAPSPAGGTAAAAAAAMAAALVAMVARGATAWADAASAATRAAELRQQLLELGVEDVAAFEAVLVAYRRRRGDGPKTGEPCVVEALLHASEVPLEIARRAADVTALAVLAAREGRGPMRLDAKVAALLAEAATRASAAVVRGNLNALPQPTDPARALLADACATEERAASALADSS